MNETTDYGKIISKNLKRIAYEHNRTQADIARALNINKTTVSSWMSGARVPRMSKVDMLCRYFGVERSDIIEPYDPDKKRDFALSPSEIDLIRAYRTAPESRRESVRALLNMDKKGNDRQEAAPYSA